ncbi:hypothetical protein ALC56_05948, partial [Trachymyrmex septentrionalis]
VDTRRTRGKDLESERSQGVCGCASRTSERASPFVLHAPAETNLPDKSWSYDRGLSRAGKEIADARAPRPTAAALRDSDRYHVNCMPSRLCTSRRRDASQWCSSCNGLTEFYDVINEASRSLNTIDNVTRLTGNPVLAYEYRGGEAARLRT